MTGQVVAGSVVTLLGVVGGWIGSTLAEAKAPFWWYLGFLLGAAVIATVIYTPWRHGVWGSIRHWRPFTTARTLDSARNAGRDEALAEVEAQRFEARKHSPHWIAAVLGKESIQFWIANAEACGVVRDVQIRAESSEFTFEDKTFIRGDFPDGMHTMFGSPTSAGRRFGVTFDLTWFDENGDKWTGQTQLPKEPRGAAIVY